MAKKNFRLTLEDADLQKWFTELQALFISSDQIIQGWKSNKQGWGALYVLKMRKKNYGSIVLGLQAIVKEVQNEMAK